MTDPLPMIERHLLDPAVMAQILAALQQRLQRTPDQLPLLRRAAAVARGLGALDLSADLCDHVVAHDPADGLARWLAIVLRGGASGLPPEGRPSNPLPFLRFTHLLDPGEQAAVWAALDTPDQQWHPTGVHDGDRGARIDPTQRHSMTLRRPERLAPLLAPRLQALVRRSGLIDWLGLAGVPLAGPDVAVVSHGAGGRFRLHTDAVATAPNRCLTYVYYLHRHPKAFEGGDLVLFDRLGAPADDAAPFTRLPPEDNSLVLFPSDQWHAVTPVQAAGADPLDGRLTINGWFHRMPVPQ